MTLVSELRLRNMGLLFSGAGTFHRFLNLLFPRLLIGSESTNRLPLSPQSFDGLVFSEFRMANLGLQIPYGKLCFGQRPLSLFACCGFGGQCGLGAL